MKYFISLLLLFLLPSVTFAETYIYSNGYYWYNSKPYTRRYSKGYYYYYPVINYSTNWKDTILRIAEQRDKYEQQRLKDEAEQKNFIEALSALGYQSHKQDFIAEQGKTIYGVEYKDVAELYGATNLDLHFNQADNHVKAAQNAAEKGVQGFKELLQQESSAKERVALVLAKAELLKSAETPSATITKTTTLTETKDNNDVSLLSVIQNKCASCHSGDSINGNIDMTKYLTFDKNKRDLVQQRLITNDPQKRMPLKRSADGGFEPGEPLLFEEIVSFK